MEVLIWEFIREYSLEQFRYFRENVLEKYVLDISFLYLRLCRLQVNAYLSVLFLKLLVLQNIMILWKKLRKEWSLRMEKYH